MTTWNARASYLHPNFDTWKTTQGDMIRQKAAFPMQPNNPELDIQPIRRCKVWIRKVNLIAQVKLERTEAHHIDLESPKSPENHATLAQVSDNARACIYNPDGKCLGMLSIMLYMNLANAFHCARDSGYHNQVMPPSKHLNSELVGLLTYIK